MEIPFSCAMVASSFTPKFDVRAAREGVALMSRRTSTRRLPERHVRSIELLPHIGSATIESRTNMGMVALDNIDAVLNGRAPPRSRRCKFNGDSREILLGSGLPTIDAAIGAGEGILIYNIYALCA